MTERSAFLDHKFLNCPGRNHSTRDALRLVTLGDFWKDVTPLPEVSRGGALRQIPDKSHGDNLGRVDDNVSEEEKKFYEDNSPVVESVEKMNIQGSQPRLGEVEAVYDSMTIWGPLGGLTQVLMLRMSQCQNW